MGPVTDLVVVPSAPNIMYVGVLDGSVEATDPEHPKEVVVNHGGVYRSDDSGATWRRINADSATTSTGLLADNIPRTAAIRLAIHDDPNPASRAVYVALVGPTMTAPPPMTTLLQIPGKSARGAFIFRSDGTGGSPNWTALPEPTSIDKFWTDLNHDGQVQDDPTDAAPGDEIKNRINPLNPGGQTIGLGAIHFSMAADPTNPQILFVGGDNQPANDPKGDYDPHRNAVQAPKAAGRIFMWDGAHWVEIVGTDDQTTPQIREGANGTVPHADSRSMVFDAGGDLLEVDDGGIAKLVFRDDPVRREWQSLTPANSDVFAQTLEITEFYSVALGTVGTGAAPSTLLIGGAQDNGVSHQPQGLVHGWTQLEPGDGAIVQVGFAGNVPTYYFSRNMFDGFTAWTDNNPNNGEVDPNELVVLQVVDSISGVSLAAAAGPPLDFLTPYIVNSQPGASSQLLVGGKGLWEITNVNANAPVNGQRTVVAVELEHPGTESFKALAYGGVDKTTGMPNPNVIHASRGRSLFGRSSPGGPLSGDALPKDKATILDAALDPPDWATTYCTAD